MQNSLEKLFYIFYFLYVLTIFIMRCVLNKEARNCDDFESNAYPISFYSLSIASVFFNIFSFNTIPFVFVKNSTGCIFFLILSSVITIALSGIHFSIIFNAGIKINKCTTNIFVLNILMSVPAFVFIFLITSVFGIFLFGVVVGVVKIIYYTFINPIKERNYRGGFVNYALVWIITQIICLSLYPASSYIQGIASTELILIFAFTFYFIDLPYKQGSRILYLAIIFGLTCLILQILIDGEISVVGINSFLPFAIICIIYMIISIYGRKPEIELPAVIVDISSGLPPMICASGNSNIYKKLNVK